MVALLLIGPIVGALVGYLIGQGKGRGGLGFVLGLFLGFIGWIIVACTSPTDEYQARQAAILTDAFVRVAPPPPAVAAQGTTRSCPYCAEDIKVAATVCRFCGHDVEPLSPTELDTAQASESELLVRQVAAEHPSSYEHARPHLDALPRAPEHPAAWLGELCARIEAGSPPDRAAERIPLDWSPSPVAAPSPMPVVTRGGAPPERAGDFPNVAEAFPAEYNRARSILAGLDARPEQPELWLAELCERMHNGSPAGAAAARIPLNWGLKDSAAAVSTTVRDATSTCGTCGAPNRASAKFCGSCGDLATR